MQRIFKFMLVGGLGAGLNTFLLWLFTDTLKVYYLFSSLCAIEFCILLQFIINDRWTFQDRKTRTVKQLFRRLLLSNTWRTGGIIVNVGILWLLTESLGKYYLVSNVMGIFAAFLFNYLLESTFTWPDPIQS